MTSRPARAVPGTGASARVGATDRRRGLDALNRLLALRQGGAGIPDRVVEAAIEADRAELELRALRGISGDVSGGPSR